MTAPGRGVAVPAAIEPTKTAVPVLRSWICVLLGNVAAIIIADVPPRFCHAESTTTTPPPELPASFNASCSPNVPEERTSATVCALETVAVIDPAPIMYELSRHPAPTADTVTVSVPMRKGTFVAKGIIKRSSPKFTVQFVTVKVIEPVPLGMELTGRDHRPKL